MMFPHSRIRVQCLMFMCDGLLMVKIGKTALWTDNDLFSRVDLFPLFSDYYQESETYEEEDPFARKDAFPVFSDQVKK